MKIKIQNKELDQLVGKFQEGGELNAPAAPAEPAPAEGGQEDPMAQLVQAFAQGLQNQDCQLLAQAAQAFLELVGGGEPQAPSAPQGQQPVFKKGGRLVKWISK